MFFKKNKLIWLILFAFLLACKADLNNLFKPTYHTQVGAPIAFGKLNIFNVIKDDNSILNLNPDSSLYANFPFQLFDIPLKDLIATKADFKKTGNINVNNRLIFGFNLYNQDLDIDISNGLNNPLARLNEMECISGQMDVTLFNKLQIPVKNILIKLPNVSVGGSPVPDIFYSVINPGGSQTFSININDYKFLLNGKSLSAVNSIFCRILADSASNSGNVTQYNLLTDSLLLRFNFKNLIIKKGIGKFGTFSQEAKDTIDFFGPGFYNNFSNGSFLLKNSSIKFNIDNTGGIPYNVELNLKTKNGNNGNEISLSPKPNYQLIKAFENPLKSNTENNRIISNATGYNLDEVLSNIPKNLFLNVGINNPDSDPTAFVYNESRVKVSMELDIPLDISFNKLKLVDTFKFNMGNLTFDTKGIDDTTKSKFESGSLFFRTINGFPFDFNFSAKLLDKDKKEILNLFSNEFVKAGLVDLNGKVTTKELSRFQVPLSMDTYNKLKLIQFIEINYVIDNKTNLQNYKIYSTYNLDFKVSGEVRLKKKF